MNSRFETRRTAHLHAQSALRARRSGQRGQALIYGIFVLIGGLAALFFLFNTGQLTREKTKLVNTADAVAYAAGVLHARALNFDAYGNRALVANEVLVAQMVSLSSWAQYVREHIDQIPKVFPVCEQPIEGYYNPYGGGFYVMSLLTGPEYAAACNVLADQQLGVGQEVARAADEGVNIAKQVVFLAQRNKDAITTAQQSVQLGMLAARDSLMKEVADANYRNDGSIDVDSFQDLPSLTDDWSSFTHRYSGDERGRMAEVAKQAAYGDKTGDDFVRSRSWSASQLIPTDWQCMVRGWRRSEVRRRGGTELIDYDEWKAEDTVSYHRFFGSTRWGIPRCRESEFGLGWGEQQAHPSSTDPDESGASLGGSPATNPGAHAQASSNAWTEYKGLPSFYDLSAAMLAKTSNLDDANAARLRFTVRLRRSIGQTVTSEGRSEVKPTPTLNAYRADAAQDSATHDTVLSQIATGEVYFRRPPVEENNVFGADMGRPVELGSLFNPYWQVRLVTPSVADFAAALFKQGATNP
jgi:putative Flp pilus-assembly TadE/G-like protein